MKIEHIVVINLKDKFHRWAKFCNLHPMIERFDAIDSRDDYRVSHAYGLKLSPVAVADKLYFSQTTGSVGAYCSHYLIWKHMLTKNWNNVLILEDDSDADDVKKLLSEDMDLDDTYDIYQFNKRWHHATNFHMNFDGLESYLLTNRAAQILVDSTHNRTHFNNKIISGPYGKYKKSCLHDTGLFNSTETQDWSETDVISTAVDKFVGFCSSPKLSKERRLSIKFLPRVATYQQLQKSDIAVDGIRPWHECSEYELLNFLKSPYYQYWKYNLFLSPNHIPVRNIKFSFLTSSMNRCDDLKKTYIDNIKMCISELNVDFEFVLLNYNSSDDIDNWSRQSNIGKLCNFNYIKTNKYPYFNMSRAKNILGRAATGDIVCWLDADNILSSEYLSKLVEDFATNKNMFSSVLYDKNSPGICGRISCCIHDFYRSGGYDESFEGWGYEDVDFTKRLQLLGLFNKLVPSCMVTTLNHQTYDKFTNYKVSDPNIIPENSPFVDFKHASNLINFAKSQENISNGQYVANRNTQWGLY